jgi:cell wall-associated NlpC family hydrolase
VRARGICVVLAITGISAASAPGALAKKKATTSAVVSSGGAVYTPPAPVTSSSSVTSSTSTSSSGTSSSTSTTTTGTTGTTGLSLAAQLEASTGGQAFGQPNPAVTPTVPGTVAVILPDGMAAAPLGAPAAVRAAIWAANLIVGLPYIYGGGHAAFIASGYDCSGTVSYALHGAALIKTPMDSSDFMDWGTSGVGQWITIFTNPSHVYMDIAGIRLDTSREGDPGGLPGPEWRPVMKVQPAHYHKRYLPGL